MIKKSTGILSAALTLALGAGSFAVYKKNAKSETNDAASDQIVTLSSTSS